MPGCWLPLFKGLFVVANPSPVTAALNLVGIDVGDPRLPLLPLEEELKLNLQRLLTEIQLV